jgi:hypothetical protein
MQSLWTARFLGPHGSRQGVLYTTRAGLFSTEFRCSAFAVLQGRSTFAKALAPFRAVPRIRRSHSVLQPGEKPVCKLLVIRPTKRKASGGDDSQLQQHRTRNRSPRREARESQANDECGGARFIVVGGEEGQIHVRDLRHFAVSNREAGHGGRRNGIAFPPQGSDSQTNRPSL